MQIRNLKQALNHGLVLKKSHKVIELKKSVVKIIYSYKQSTKKISKKQFWKRFLRTNN